MRDRLVIDLKQSKWIPVLSMCTLCVYMAVSFFELEMALASYAALALTLLTWGVSMMLQVNQLKIEKHSVWVLGLMMWILLITLMRGQVWNSWLYFTLAIMACLSLFHYYRDMYDTLIKAAVITLSCCVYAQLIQCILHPEMWLIESLKHLHGYLLGGNYNGIGSRIIPTLAFGAISWQYGRGYKINMVVLSLASIAILGMVKSMTAFTCTLAFLSTCFIANKQLLRHLIMGVAIAWLIFEVLVCFQGNSLAQNEFAKWFIEDVLDKDLTFTGRTDLWEASLHAIGKSPILGYGDVDKDWYLLNISNKAYGTHNFILTMLIWGGVVALALYVKIVLLSCKTAIQRNDSGGFKLVLSFAFLSIMMLFETYPIPLVLLLLIAIYYYQPLNNSSSDTTL